MNYEQSRTRIELFTQWKSLQEDIQIIAGIVQNEMPINDEMIQDWHTRIERLRYKVSRLELKTTDYLNGEMIRAKQR